MTETLLLRPSPDAQNRFDGVVLGRDGQLVEQSIGADPFVIEAIANGRRVVGLIPGGDVLLTAVRLPPMPTAKLRQGVAYALEDQLIDDLELQHFALGERVGEEQSVGVIARRRLQHWLDRYGAVGVAPRALHADTACIAPKPGDVLVWIDGYDARIVSPDGNAEYAPVALLEEALRQRLTSAGASTVGLWIYATPADLKRQAAPIDSLRRLGAALQLHALQTGPLPWLATYWSISRPINLLQGEYAPRATINPEWRRWRWAAGLAALLLIAYPGSRELEWARLQGLERDVDAELLSQAAVLSPGITSAEPAAALLRRQLQRLQADTSPDPRALRELERLALARGQVADVRLQSLSQQADGTVVVIGAGAVEVAEAFASALRAAGLPLQPIEIRSTERGVEATLRWPAQAGARRT
jgi:general secretion pathway protein L